ncbi:MAG: O-antigen ligase family protein [Microgenomates group bacterium]
MLKQLKLPEINILSLIIIALLIFIPLYPKFPLFNVKGTYVAIRIEDFLVAFSFLIWFLTEVRSGFSSFKNKVSRLILLYWLVGGLSLGSALLITKNITPHIAFLHFLRRVEYMGLFFVAYSSLKDLRQVKSYILTLFLVTVGIGIYAVGQKFFGWPVVSTMNKEFSKGMLLQLTEWTRVNSTFAGHYDLAAFLVMILALVAGFLAGIKNKGEKIFALGVGIFAFYTLLLTASRISFAAYLLGVTFVLIFLKKYLWIGPFLAFSILGMVFSSDLGQRYALTFNINLSAISSRLPRQEAKIASLFITPTPTSSPTPPAPVLPEKKPKMIGPISKISPTSTPTPTPTVVEVWRPTTEVAVEYSSGIRFNVEWPRALRALAKNPFLGTGYSSITLATDNDYLRALGETGILGFLSFALIFLEAGHQIIKRFFQKISKFEKGMILGISGVVLGILINAVFIDVFEASKVAFVFWMLMGILVKTVNIQPKKLNL